MLRRPGEVLVKVAAAGVNPIDFKTRGAQGGVPKWAVTLPKIPGGDVAGVVVEADDSCKVKPLWHITVCRYQTTPEPVAVVSLHAHCPYGIQGLIMAAAPSVVCWVERSS
jgi:NADPH:quinone reductase-like Zn-dependent oxidoreductase